MEELKETWGPFAYHLKEENVARYLNVIVSP
jgi:hypothetical protein